MVVADVVVDVVGGADADAQVSGKLHHQPVAPGVSLHEILLQLEIEALGAEPVQVSFGHRPGLVDPAGLHEGGYLALSASGQDDQALRVLRKNADVQLGLRSLLGEDVGEREQAAQIGVTLDRLRQGRQMMAALERELDPEDPVEAQGPADLREPHGAAQVVMVGQGEAHVSQLPGPGDQLIDRGRPVLEGEVAVAVKLSVLGRSHASASLPVPSAGEEVLEDGQALPFFEDALEVPPRYGPLAPPLVVQTPGILHRLHRRRRLLEEDIAGSVLGFDDPHRSRLYQRTTGSRACRRSGILDHGSTSLIWKIGVSSPSTASSCLMASCSWRHFRTSWKRLD